MFLPSLSRLVVAFKLSSTASESPLHVLVPEHFSHVDADPHEVALWVLLKRTKSADKAVRLKAVQELAENHHWHGNSRRRWLQMTRFNPLPPKINPASPSPPPLNDTDYQYQTAAQVIDQRTAVGLARTRQVDLRFFLRKPSLPDLDGVRIHSMAVFVLLTKMLLSWPSSTTFSSDRNETVTK